MTRLLVCLGCANDSLGTGLTHGDPVSFGVHVLLPQAEQLALAEIGRLVEVLASGRIRPAGRTNPTFLLAVARSYGVPCSIGSALLSCPTDICGPATKRTTARAHQRLRAAT